MVANKKQAKKQARPSGRPPPSRLSLASYVVFVGQPWTWGETTGDAINLKKAVAAAAAGVQALGRSRSSDARA